MNLFTADLGEPMRSNVEMQQSADLQNAMSLARAFERRSSAPTTTATLPVAHSQQRSRFQLAGSFQESTAVSSQPTVASLTAVSATPLTRSKFCRLSPYELANKRKKRECYFCPKKFT
jgi:hypothetical protein